MTIAKRTRLSFQYVASFSLIAFVITFFVLKSDQMQLFLNSWAGQYRNKNASSSSEICDFFSGKWIYDVESQVPYNGTQCSFMLGEYACEEYGRKDSDYLKWRWQPHGCNLPRFNGTELLEKLRGKKLVFVGDSLNRNQWISMLCLLESSLPPSSSKYFTREANFFLFRNIGYNTTIAFYWSPFLVESNNDHPYNREPDRVVRIEAIEKHAIQWTDADILVFDSFAWWSLPKLTLSWGSFGSSDAVNETVDTNPSYYRMGLKTWSDWLEIHINRTRTKLFFMSVSPTHYEWEEDMSEKQQCYNESKPISNERYEGGYRDREMMEVAESTIHRLENKGVKVQYLNITYLSDYRKDAHPSIYRQIYHPLTEEQLKDPKNYSDCLHWCLPGVPDVWNQILYFYLTNSEIM